MSSRCALTERAQADGSARDRATLHLGDVEYALEGEWSDDWLAALAAFLDCGFEPHDALVLALAWRAGDERARRWPVDFSHVPERRRICRPRRQSRSLVALTGSGLYPVLPSAEWVERVLDLGVKTVQLRRKTDRFRRTEAGNRTFGGCGPRSTRRRLFINDHWQEAHRGGRVRRASRAGGRGDGRPERDRRSGLAPWPVDARLLRNAEGAAFPAELPRARRGVPDHDQSHADRAARFARAWRVMCACSTASCRSWRSAASNGAGAAAGAGDRRRQRGSRAGCYRSRRSGCRHFCAATRIRAIMPRVRKEVQLVNQRQGTVTAAFA